MKEKIKMMSAGRFLYESGLLFEINRKVLHPFGLALTIKYDDKKGTLSEEEAIIKLNDKMVDERDEPGGMIFNDEDLRSGKAKYETFWEEFGKSYEFERAKLLGFIIQEEAGPTGPPERHKEEKTVAERNAELKKVKVGEEEIIDKENYIKVKKYVGQKHTQPGKPNKECISTANNTVHSSIPGGSGIVICTDCGRSLNDPDLST